MNINAYYEALSDYGYYKSSIIPEYEFFKEGKNKVVVYYLGNKIDIFILHSKESMSLERASDEYLNSIGIVCCNNLIEVV